MTAHEQRQIETLRRIITQIRQSAFSLSNLDIVEGARMGQIEYLEEVASELEEELEELESD